MQEDRSGDAVGIRRLARLHQVAVQFLRMGQGTGAGTTDVGLDDLLVCRPVQAAGQIIGNLVITQIEHVGSDKESVSGPSLPQVTDYLRQQPKDTARLL